MKLFIFIAMVTLSFSSKSQNTNLDTNILSSKMSFFRFYPSIYQNGNRINKKEQLNTFKQFPEAFKHFMSYRRNYNNSLYSIIGCFLGMGVSVIGSENKNQSIKASGLIFSIASFASGVVFMSTGDAKLRKAIKVYNEKVTLY